MIKHIEDYPTMNMDPWDFENRGEVSPQEAAKQKKQARSGYVHKAPSKHWFVDDTKHPYDEVKRFDWIRGYHVGGRSLTWGRHSYRWSEMDFEANAKDGTAVDWPIRYTDLSRWYDHVETFAGISGSLEGLPQLPDGKFLPPMEMNCVEKEIKQKIEKDFPTRKMIIGRCAHLTKPTAEHLALGRGRCMSREECQRGCSFGAFFSSLSATLPAAKEFIAHRARQWLKAIPLT